MSKDSSSADGILVGLEIHQQLNCSTKLFCACPPLKSDVLPYHFERRLRPAQSETGRIDPAAVFEFSKAKSNTYFWSPESSCLVEADEEPPHPLSEEALDAALLTAKTLGSNVIDEVHVMRKIVIDGSNTAGFQRTAVVGLGGFFNVDGTQVGVQSVTLEEDAARIMGQDGSSRHYALDRIGVALVEVALEPVRGDPEFVGKVALYLGRMLRSTGKVARGLGTIRQDLNISVMGGRVVEVKGVQKLNLLPKVVEYERKRQQGLVRIAERVKERGLSKVRCKMVDVSAEMAGSSSRVFREQLSSGGRVTAIVAFGMGGLIGWEPLPGVRLGRELAEVARANSLGGVIHSDEFERQGITPNEEALLKKATGSTKDDALVLLAGPAEAVAACVPNIMARLQSALNGVPAETRAATEAGETRYMRPRPGSQRMYPETDIPDIEVEPGRLRRLAESVPENWETRVEHLSKSYSLSNDLALKIYDAELDEDFERLCRDLRMEPSVVASTLADLPARLSREGVPEGALTLEVLTSVLRAVSEGTAAKEAIPEILKAVGKTGVQVTDAIRSLGLEVADESKVRSTVDAILARRSGLVSERGESAFSVLMGEAMKELRGKADGAMVGRILRERLEEAAQTSNT
jgi:glutamyl-tRNA(Gln) amidotransferase subunit E